MFPIKDLYNDVGTKIYESLYMCLYRYWCNVYVHIRMWVQEYVLVCVDIVMAYIYMYMHLDTGIYDGYLWACIGVCGHCHRVHIYVYAFGHEHIWWLCVGMYWCVWILS